MTSPAAGFIFFDTESTGLEDDAHPLEFAFVAVDRNLRELDAFETLVLPQATTRALIAANDVVEKMHTDNGLIRDLFGPPPSVHPTLDDIEDRVLAMIDENYGPDAVIHFAGGGIAGYDVPLVRRTMPRLAGRVHYRPIDISIIATGYAAATGDTATLGKADGKAHRAMADIREDLELARQEWELFRAAATQVAGDARGDEDVDAADLVLGAANIVQSVAYGGGLNAIAEEMGQSAMAGLSLLSLLLAQRIAESDGVTIAKVLDEVRREAVTEAQNQAATAV